MKIIAIHDGHTASIAYMEDGKVEFAIQEERLTKVKNAGGFPKLGLAEVLKRYNLNINRIDNFVFSGNEPQFSEVDSRKHVLRKYYNLFNTKPYSIYRHATAIAKFSSIRFMLSGLSKLNIRLRLIDLWYGIRRKGFVYMLAVKSK